MRLTALKVEKDMTDKRLAAIKVEKDLKEKEAAAHLEEVEKKAARVDELEKQHVLLEMDKDRLKMENGKLIDQLRSTGNKVNTEFLRANDRAATLFGGKKDLNKYSNRQSAQVGGVPGLSSLALGSKSAVHGIVSKKTVVDPFAKGPINMD